MTARAGAVFPPSRRRLETTAPHILVVEDEAQDRLEASGLLLGCGYRVTTARTRRAADAVFADAPADLVVYQSDSLDWRPWRRPWREGDERDHVPLILLSRGADPDGVLAAVEQGADDVVSIPFLPDELIARVRVHLRHVRRYKELLRASSIDDLTDVLNRRGIFAVLARELAEARRAERPLSIAIADVDDFKRINDGFGHPAGDAVLRQVAQVLGSRVRDSDQIGRIGGDEFLIVCPATRGSECVALVRRLGASFPLRFRGHRTRFRLSAGCATASAGDSIDSLVRRADATMYREKRAMRKYRAGGGL